MMKKFYFNNNKVTCSFTCGKLTHHAGLAPIVQKIKKQGIFTQINRLFPTAESPALRFRISQLLMSVVLASMSGVNRLSKIANFTNDPLVMHLISLSRGLNKDVISTRLQDLGEAGAHRLHEYTLAQNKDYIAQSGLKQITLDADSTVSTVYGNQEGAEKGYNPHKQGAKSYHPILIFASELKTVVNSWLRPGSAYTSNGIVEFAKQTKEALPEQVKDVLFRADSGFFNGQLFDLFESEEFQWNYLVKVKLKNLKELICHLEWSSVKGHTKVSVAQLQYQCKSWSKPRTLKVIRTIVGYNEKKFLWGIDRVPIYEYACYCSTLNLPTEALHDLYKQRSTSETWIEQVKSQLMANKTVTKSFWANDILWQLSIWAYNLSVMIRHGFGKVWQQEHDTFRNWFINVPGLLICKARQWNLKMHCHFYQKQKWLELESWFQRT